jgi:glycosyltransferase involved in cell wall biosynthesis
MKPLKTRNYFPTEPWNQPLGRRLRQLASDQTAGFMINVYLYEKPDASTFRYRVYNMAKALETGSSWRAAFFFADELEQIQDLILDCQLLTLVRFRWTYALENLVQAARIRGIPILFDTDDLVFDIAHVPALINMQNIDQRTDSEMNYWFSYAARLEKSASLADAMLTTNDYLARFLTDSFQKPVYVIRNFLNREQIDFSTSCLAEKRRAPRSSRFTLGYFSGSPSHFFDLHSITDELCALLEDIPDLELLIVGYMDLAPQLAKYARQGRITCHKLVDFLTLQRLIAQVDLNLAPLYKNDFTECKSELKYFEAAIVETLTIASPTYTFRHAISSGVNGYLCRQGEWYATIHSIYHNQENQKPVLARARELVRQTYSPEVCRTILEEVFASILRLANKSGTL